jgi:hypothetical protein
MSIDALEEITLELMKAVGLCREHTFYQSSLILIYSGIDTMAWLSLPESKLDVNKFYFEKWVNKYLLPNSGLLCSATELYGARCGLVHSHTSESKLYREGEGEVRKIYYAYYRKGTVGGLQKTLEETGESSVVPVQIEMLQTSFMSAISGYGIYLANHPKEREIAVKRADKFLVKKKILEK